MNPFASESFKRFSQEVNSQGMEYLVLVCKKESLDFRVSGTMPSNKLKTYVDSLGQGTSASPPTTLPELPVVSYDLLCKSHNQAKLTRFYNRLLPFNEFLTFCIVVIVRS